MNIEEKKEHYRKLCHAMQTGIAVKMNYDDGEVQLKHLRVGINTSMSEHAALVYLLIKKGIITEDEYYDMLISFMEQEVEAYRQELQLLIGANVKLA